MSESTSKNQQNPHFAKQINCDVADKMVDCSIGVAETVERWETVHSRPVQVKMKPTVMKKPSKLKQLNNMSMNKDVVLPLTSGSQQVDTSRITSGSGDEDRERNQDQNMDGCSMENQEGEAALESKQNREKVDANIRRPLSLRGAIPLKAINDMYGIEQLNSNAQENSSKALDDLDQDVDGHWDNESSLSDPLSWLNEPLFQMMDYEDFSDVDKEKQEARSSAMDFVRSSRTLWAHVNQVIDSKIVDHLSRKDLDFQESKFEILTSEASYLKSLNLLKTHFLESAHFNNDSILPRKDLMSFISYIKPIRKCSKAFLRDLEKCWQESIFLPDIFNVIHQHSKDNFNVYVTYCSHLKEIQGKLRSFTENKKYVEALKSLEGDEKCSALPLESFMRLPMDRITKLPLPLEKALKTLTGNRESYGTVDYETERGSGLLARDYLLLVVNRCNTVTRINNRMKEMMEIHSKMKFPNIQPTSLISPDRWLERKDELKSHDLSEIEKKASTVSKRKGLVRRSLSLKRFQKSSSTRMVFTLNDMIIVTKHVPKSDCYEVTDYCYRENVILSSAKWLDKEGEYFFVLIFKENHEKKNAEFFLSFTKEDERDNYVSKINEKPVKVDELKDKKMVCVYSFRTHDPAQLQLELGDEVTITKTLENGWLEGVRKRGNKSGTFPPSRVETNVLETEL